MVEMGPTQTSSMLDLLSYLLGVSREEISRLVTEFSAEGGADNPRNLFSFLATQTRQYSVLWGIAPHTDQLSLVAVAVVGPGREVVWWAVSAVPYNRDNAAFRLWHRVVEAASGKTSLGATPPSESDYWGAEQVARQYGAQWPAMVTGMVAELETAMAAKPLGQANDGEGFFEDPALTRRFSMLFEQHLREALGKSTSLTALRLSRVSLPDLRDLGLEVAPLQQSLDDYLGLHFKTELPKEVAVNAGALGDSGTLIFPDVGVRELDPVVDPLGGVPLSSVVPGDVMLLQEIGAAPLPGRVYLVRVMRNGQFEIYGHLGGDKGFFKAMAPGDIKISLSASDGEGPTPALENVLLWGAVVVVAALVAVLIFFLWG